MKHCCINFDCDREIDFMEDFCPYCGYPQYDESGREDVISEPFQKRKKEWLHDFSDEEILAIGLYPKNETYKMSLISRILGKR